MAGFSLFAQQRPRSPPHGGTSSAIVSGSVKPIVERVYPSARRRSLRHLIEESTVRQSRPGGLNRQDTGYLQFRARLIHWMISVLWQRNQTMSGPRFPRRVASKRWTMLNWQVGAVKITCVLEIAVSLPLRS